MKSIARILCLLLAAIAATAQAQTPKITSLMAVPGVAGSAVLSAKVTTSSGSPAKVFFDYGPTTGYGSTRETAVSPNANAEIATVVLSGLTTGVPYNFRVRVETVEGDSAVAVGAPFLQSARVTLTPVVHNATTGAITLNGVVVPNGVAGAAIFEYGEGDAFDKTIPAAPSVVAGTETTVPVTAVLPDGIFGVPVFNYRLVFIPVTGTPARIVSTVGRTNTSPKAVADAATQTSIRPISIAVLENDTDAESDALQVKSVTPARFGTVTFTATSVTYTPTQELLVADSFRYTIEDGFTGKASATVTIRPLRGVLAGTHGGIVRDSSGKEIGYFSIHATSQGSFTGVIEIEGKRYLLSGNFSANGSFHGAARRDGKIVSVDLATVRSDGGTTIRADFGEGTYAANIDFTDDEATTRGPLAGRYTVELPSSTGGGTGGGTGGIDTTTLATGSSTPEGTGWSALKVGYDGSVRVKGRLPDGRKFDARGALVVGPDGPQITFFDDPKGTRVVGTFNVGDTLTGSLLVDRPKSNDGTFPAGYDLTLTANGARYVSPKEGGGVTSSDGGGAENFTITFNGGGIASSFSRNMQITDSNQAKVLNGGPEDLQVKIDPSSGRFTTKLTVNNDGRRVKGTGVFIQGNGDTTAGSGAGVFNGVNQPGSIQITAGATPVPTPRPTTPTPVFPTPGPIIPIPTPFGLNPLR